MPKDASGSFGTFSPVLSHFAHVFFSAEFVDWKSFIPFYHGAFLNQTSVMWSLAWGLVMLRIAHQPSIKEPVKYLLIIGLSHPFKTIVVLAMDAIPVALFLNWPNYFMATIVLWILIGFSLIALINSVIFSRLFAKYEPVQMQD